MEKITIFHLDHCPYCRNGRRALEELQGEDEAYRSLEIEWVEESRYPQRAAEYDYYYVPTVFAGQTKLYEAQPGESYEQCRARLKAALDTALGR